MLRPFPHGLLHDQMDRSTVWNSQFNTRKEKCITIGARVSTVARYTETLEGGAHSYTLAAILTGGGATRVVSCNHEQTQLTTIIHVIVYL